MKELYHGKYVSGLIWKGVSGRWYADVSYFSLKAFDSRSAAMKFMEEVGVFQK